VADFSMRLELRKPVRCSDRTVAGELGDIVIDPVARRVTHLVVKDHEDGRSRLVPIDLAEAGEDGGEILLSCTAEDVHRLSDIEGFAYLHVSEFPGNGPDWDVGVVNVLTQPSYESTGFGTYPATFEEGVGMTYDRVPKGEVEIRHSSSVTTSNGHPLGDVDGLVVRRDGMITHVVIERGHLWRRREVTLPVGAVTRWESDSLTVGLSADEIAALPTRRFHRWPF
jgi:sporulation protein YlmC with PRC-barrel domain